MFDGCSTEVRLLRLPGAATLAAAHDPAPNPDRELVVVRLTDADGANGWGECSALNTASYTHEWAEGAFELLATAAAGEREPFAQLDYPMAAAAMEMAALDLSLRADGLSLAAHLGASHDRVPAGAVVGLGSVNDTLDAVERLAADGFGRIKLKIVPGSLDVVLAVRRAFDELELQVDGNGSFDANAVDDLAALADDADLDAIEQPFDADDLDAAADLVERSAVPVLADEPIDGHDDAMEIFEQAALSGIVVKPPKVGGIARAMELVDWASELGIPLAAGGMLESGLGRHALCAVAAVDGFTITGDVSPARRWLADDPWPDLDMHDGWIGVPTGPGVAPDPDEELLDRYTVRRWPHSS